MTLCIMILHVTFGQFIILCTSLVITSITMKQYSCSILLLVLALASALILAEALPKDLFERGARRIEQEDLLGPSDPLILTQYLNDPATARKLSEVHDIGSYPSYAGYFTVNATYGSNMFFWYFPAQNGNKQAPLIMFLQGGPGASSMFGLFAEMGPYKVASDGKTLLPNSFTWNKEYSMVCVHISNNPAIL
jgi:vitellogenic carboxypeptidase-like protein